LRSRSSRSRAAIVLALACVALVGAVLAGCGSDSGSKNDYVDRMNQVQSRFATTFESLAGQITATSTPDADRRTLEAARQSLDQTVAQLRKVHPPQQVAKLHDQLASEVEAYGNALTAAADALGSSDADVRAKATANLSEATSRTSADVNQTITAINRKLHE